MISKLLHVHMHARTHVHKSTFTLIVIDWEKFKCLKKKKLMLSKLVKMIVFIFSETTIIDEVDTIDKTVGFLQ